MPCLSPTTYFIHGCTDASVYYEGSETIDFQLECQSNAAGVLFHYKANLQFYNTNTSTWVTVQVKSGSFENKTSVFSYDLANRAQGTYRIKVDFESINSTWSTQTSNFYVYK